MSKVITPTMTQQVSIEAPNPKMALSVRNLDLYYGSHQALFSINIDIPKYEITALIGPSGCGKSSFLKCLDRLVELDPHTRVDGTIWMEGKNIYTEFDPMILRQKIGMVFQQPNPFPMSIFDNVAYGPRLQGIRKMNELQEIVEKSLRDAAIWDELKDRLKRSALALSGGQQQRLCIARALAANPEILLMDEPTSALDPISTGKIEELAVKLKEKYTIVIVTHNMQQASRIADQTAFFYLGQMLELAPTAQLFTHPQHPKTQEYIAV